MLQTYPFLTLYEKNYDEEPEKDRVNVTIYLISQWKQAAETDSKNISNNYYKGKCGSWKVVWHKYYVKIMREG
jgi:hypothetical protein